MGHPGGLEWAFSVRDCEIFTNLRLKLYHQAPCCTTSAPAARITSAAGAGQYRSQSARRRGARAWTAAGAGARCCTASAPPSPAPSSAAPPRPTPRTRGTSVASTRRTGLLVPVMLVMNLVTLLMLIRILDPVAPATAHESPAKKVK